jgi:hypothetical protein
MWVIWNYTEFTLCEIDEVHIIHEETFLEIHLTDVRDK